MEVKTSQKPVVTRFAPSPTGVAHAGTFRTAIYAWLYARHMNGKFIVRIEDTDTARNVPGSREGIYGALEWLGLDIDERYLQSEHVERHRQVLEEMIANDKAYISREEAKDGSGVIKEIVRFRNPNKVVIVHDHIKGDVVVDTTDLGDFVIARSITEPLFHLAVVVDDHDEGVTIVIRGDDHLSNTPRHILLYEAMGWDVPEYAHLPLVLGTDKQKLSKRRGALSIAEYGPLGFLPDAVLNGVALVGWNPGEGSEQEIFTRAELIEQFTLERVQKSSAVFNPEKLEWFNREYLKKLPHDEQVAATRPYVAGIAGFREEVFQKIVPLLMERISKWSDINTMIADGEVQYYFVDPVVTAEMLPGKNNTLEVAKENLGEVTRMLVGYTGDWSVESLKEFLMPLADARGRGTVLWPLRVALSGREKSPDPFTLLFILGSEASIRRITTVLSL